MLCVLSDRDPPNKRNVYCFEVGLPSEHKSQLEPMSHEGKALVQDLAMQLRGEFGAVKVRGL
jgi:hypothetical protein